MGNAALHSCNIDLPPVTDKRLSGNIRLVSVGRWVGCTTPGLTKAPSEAPRVSPKSCGPAALFYGFEFLLLVAVDSLLL